ncbi:YebC/PmpR family DNA-binding transcriptional regulator [Candidatus Peregrinibacteria bacterium]|nr:YebC/PmpR family DNA-binding transcriptional regulator [Candidatus Peregrinibacteria bacterium]
MARHSHWAQIKLKKGATDVKRGKTFTKHARLIELAARQGGGDAAMNPGLRLAMENARADNLPRENIERAIKKGTGELKEGEQLQEVVYEGYAPGGVALLIEVLTDNKNRTNQTIRTILQKHGGSIGSIGSTNFLFERKGVLAVKAKNDRDSGELEMIDAGADDIEERGLRVEGRGWRVYTAANQLAEVKKNLEIKGFAVESAQLQYVPKNLVEVGDSEVGKKLLDLLEALDKEDDVSMVAANFDFRNITQ